MVVGYNEAHLLENCLQSISFCDEIFYTDLGSSDNSVTVAKKFTDNILYRNKENVPSCEMVQTEVVHLLKNDWVLFIDPDEEVDTELSKEIFVNFYSYQNDEMLAAVQVPWIFYFKNKTLKGTIWGGENKKIFLVNRKRFDFLPVIHFGRRLKEGFDIIEIPLLERNCLHHYWMHSYSIFLKKHLRYLKTEGIDQYNMGRRIALKTLAFIPFKYFWECFYKKQGFKDGILGFNLSIFWAWYQSVIVLKILRLQMNK